MADDSTLPYSITDDDFPQFSNDEQHESPKTSGAVDDDLNATQEQSGTAVDDQRGSPKTSSAVDDDLDNSREHTGAIDNEQPRGLGYPQHSSQSLNSTESDSSKGQGMDDTLLERDRKAYPYGRHFQTQPKGGDKMATTLFGLEYPAPVATANIMKHHHGIVPRLSIDADPIPIVQHGSVKHDMFPPKKDDAQTTTEMMIEGSDYQRKEQRDAEVAARLRKFYSDPNPRKESEDASLPLLKPSAKRRRRHSQDAVEDFGLGKGGSLGTALKGVGQPPKMRRYNTQSTIEPSMDSEANISSSDPSHFSSFEKQQHEDDSSFEQQHYDDRHFRQGSPASSETSEVAAEISKVDVQDLSSWNVSLVIYTMNTPNRMLTFTFSLMNRQLMIHTRVNIRKQLKMHKQPKINNQKMHKQPKVNNQKMHKQLKISNQKMHRQPNINNQKMHKQPKINNQKTYK